MQASREAPSISRNLEDIATILSHGFTDGSSLWHRALILKKFFPEIGRCSFMGLRSLCSLAEAVEQVGKAVTE